MSSVSHDLRDEVVSHDLRDEAVSHDLRDEAVSHDLRDEAVEQSTPGPVVPPSSGDPLRNAGQVEECAEPAVGAEVLADAGHVSETSRARGNDLLSEQCTATPPLPSHRQGLSEGQRVLTSRAPTHFLAIPLRSREVHDAVGCLQSAMMKKHRWLRSVAEPPVGLHIALFAFSLADSPVADSLESGNEANTIARASVVLHGCKDAIGQLMADHSRHAPLLPLAGLSNFGRKVVFAAFPAGHPSLRLLQDLQRLVFSEFQKAGFSIQNDKQRYRPHVALFRDSSLRLWPNVWKPWANQAFGDFPLQEIQLLAMCAKEGQFYECASTLPLGSWPRPTTAATAQTTARATGAAGSYATPQSCVAAGILPKDQSACAAPESGEKAAASRTPRGVKWSRKSKSDQPQRAFLRPTHFIGAALKSSTVRKAVEEVQSSMMEKSAWLKDAVEHAVKLHVTFFVLTLGNGSSDESLAKISSAQDVLQSCSEDVASLMADFPDGWRHSPRLPLAGLSNFSRAVVFADFPEEHRTLVLLKDLEELFRLKFKEAGLLGDAGGHPFRPHATLFKDRRNRLTKSVWGEWADTEFGECRLEEVRLLKMGAPRGQFYESLGVLPLGNWAPESADEDRCGEDETRKAT